MTSQNDLLFLQSARGQSLLHDLAEKDLSQQKLLPLISKLRKDHSSDEVSAAITMVQLRQKAIDKFLQDAAQLFFTDAALQQASDPKIRHYRTQGCVGLRVLDACCGIGTDSIAFARSGAIVHGIDYDETRIAIAKYNAQALGLDIHFEVADVTHGIDSQDYDLIFFDPARRDERGNRIFDVEAYLPPLSLIKTWDATRIMVKISPGVDLAQLEDYQARVEFISVSGDLKEAVLHFPDKQILTAVKLDEDDFLNWNNDGSNPQVQLQAPDGWLCEPDPSILRAQLVQHLADSLDGTMLDWTIAYFCTGTKPDSRWLRAWKIREWLPFNLKKLRKHLQAMNVGTITVKKRGSPITPEELIRKLKLKGDQSATVVLTRYNEQAIAIICDDILPV